MKYLKLFENFDLDHFEEDDWDFEEYPEDNFKKEYKYLKKAHEVAKKQQNSSKVFLEISYDMIDKGWVNPVTVNKYISWENIDPKEVLEFYKNKPDNYGIIHNTIIGPVVFNFPKPNKKK